MSAIFLGLLSLLIFAKPAIAGEPPIQTNPENNSTVSSPALNWQTPAYSLYSTGSPYRVQIDDDPNFTSVNKDRYKITNSYSPEDLSEATWYWRVKAKDASGIWSDWSAIWSFVLTTASSPAPIPTPTPTPTSSSTSPSSPNPPISSSFTISNIPSQIDSGQSFSVPVSITLPNNRNTVYFLSGAFKKADGTRYFGLTKINSSWIKYDGANYLNQYKITTGDSGNWTGTLEVKPDTQDTDYKGSGDYIFKVGRYTSSGSGPTWSNEATIKIISTDSDQGDNTPIKSSSPAINPTTKPASVKIKPTTSPQPKSYDRLVYHIASVAGASTGTSTSATISAAFASESAKVEVKNQRQMNPLIWVGLIFIFAGAGSIGYIYLIKKRR